MKVEFVDNSPEVLGELSAAALRALEKCGLTAEGYAKKLVPQSGPWTTGNLCNSITHKVLPNENAVYIGTNSEYAAYVELGTGIHYPGGRQDPWVYQDIKGNWHHTHGQRAQPYLKPAVADYKDDYQGIIEDELKNG